MLRSTYQSRLKLKRGDIFSRIKTIRNIHIEGADENLLSSFLNIRCPEVVFPYAMETATTLIQKSGFPPIFFAPIDFNSLYQKELASKNKN